MENLEDFKLLDNERLYISSISRDPKFTKVFRIKANDESKKIELELDMNFEIFPMKEGDNFQLLLTTSLGNPIEDKGKYVAEESERTIKRFPNYQYIMHGKIIKISNDEDKNIKVVGKTKVYASYGGLLMKLTGDKEQLKKFEDDKRLFLLIRKT